MNMNWRRRKGRGQPVETRLGALPILKKPQSKSTSMTKLKLLEIIQRLLEADADLTFLSRLSEEEIETLIACIRHRLDSPKT